MKARYSAFICLVMATGCSCFTQVDDVNFMVSYSLRVFDQPDKLGYRLELTSESINSICISRVTWPLDDELLFEDVSTFLTVSSSKILHPQKEAIAGTFGGGEYRIEPGETLYGFIPYALFGDPEEIKARPGKQLNHSVMPYLCR